MKVLQILKLCPQVVRVAGVQGSHVISDVCKSGWSLQQKFFSAQYISSAHSHADDRLTSSVVSGFGTKKFPPKFFSAAKIFFSVPRSKTETETETQTDVFYLVNQ